jgi:hypothetical protein
LAQPHFAKDRLHQFDSGPAILRIPRQADGATPPQAAAECFHAHLPLREVVQNAGRDDAEELETQRRQLFDRQQMGLQIPQPVLVFQILLMVQGRPADTDPDYFRAGIAVRENRSLVGAAARDENIEIGFVVPIRPQHPVEVGRVEPKPVAIGQGLEVLYGAWVAQPLVLARDSVGVRMCLHVSAGAAIFHGRIMCCRRFRRQGSDDRRGLRSG